MKVKKIILGVLLLALVAFVFVAYNSFNGNPVSKILAKKTVESYVASHYPEKELHVRDGFYNFKFSEYVFDVVESGNPSQLDNGPNEYEFTVRGFIKPEVIMDGIRMANLDESLMERLSAEAEQDIQAVLADKVGSVKNVDVYIEVLKGQIDEDSSWSKTLVLDQPIGIHIVLDSTNDSKEDVYESAKVIQKVLNAEGYDYDSVNINGNSFNEDDVDSPFGSVKYSAAFQKETNIQLGDIQIENQ